MGDRVAMVRLGLDGKSFETALARQGRGVKKWGDKVRSDVRSALKGAFSGLGTIAGFAGVAGIGLAAKQVLDFETNLSRLGVAARLPASGLAALKQHIFAVSTATGISADALLDGTAKFVAITGDVKTAAAGMETFAHVATATGASMDDITATAAALSQNLGITGDQMEAAFSGLLSQGKTGKVELKDMSTLVAGLAPQFAQFGHTGVDGLMEMSGLLQVVARGFDTSSEAATGLTSLMTAMMKNAGRLRSIGVNVFEVGADGKKHMRDLTDLAFELIEKSKGNPNVLLKVLGRVEAYQALVPLMTAGRKEVEAMVAEGKRGGELAKDFATMSDTPAVRIAKARAELSKTFNDALAKNLGKIAEAFRMIIGAIEYIVAHPAAALAIAAAFKGGGYLSGLGGWMGKGGAGAEGAAAALGAGGAPAARGKMNMASRIGAGLQIGAAGYASAAALGADQWQATATGVLGALSMLPGPLGAVGAAAGAAAIGLLAIERYEEGKIDAANAKLARGTYGKFLLERAGEINSKDMGTRGSAQNILLDEATKAGALTMSGQPGSESYHLDEDAYRKTIKANNEGLSDDEIEIIITRTKAALARNTGGGPGGAPGVAAHLAANFYADEIPMNGQGPLVDGAPAGAALPFDMFGKGNEYTGNTFDATEGAGGGWKGAPGGDSQTAAALRELSKVLAEMHLKIEGGDIVGVVGNDPGKGH